jgi:hypothetical protein
LVNLYLGKSNLMPYLLIIIENIRINIFKITLDATATTGGGNELLNTYGLDFCLNKSIISFGPAV